MPYKDKQKKKENHRKWHIKNRERNLKKQKEYHWKIKLEVLNKYSKNTMQCECCGVKEVKFLTIDHINGGGTKHRTQIKHHRIHIWLKMNDFPEGYRVLCHNCNQAVGIYGKCPHQEIKSEIS